MIFNRKRYESLALGCEYGSRPKGTSFIRQHALTIVVPNGVGQNVGHIHRLPPINRCAAGSAFRTNRHGPYLSAESRKAGRSSTMEFFALFVGKPNGARHAFGLRFNQLSNVRQNFGHRRSSTNKSVQLEDRLDGKQTLLVLGWSAQR